MGDPGLSCVSYIQSGDDQEVPMRGIALAVAPHLGTGASSVIGQMG